MLNDYINITPKRLAGLLENDKVSLLERAFNITNESKAEVRVSEFNDLRKGFKQPITLENIDLSNKTLRGVNLNSVIILHSNLSNANLENSIMYDAQISGDLSNINLRNTSLFNADLSDSSFPCLSNRFFSK
jgi:uncharacterized protein YjbI with pentapeptide repeats